MSIMLEVNGTRREVAADPETPLLYVLRNDLKLKGARYGCGAGFCGACMVIVDGKPVQSCDVPVSAVAGKTITTVKCSGSASTSCTSSTETSTTSSPACRSTLFKTSFNSSASRSASYT